jgi:CMP/dCMP kinase
MTRTPFQGDLIITIDGPAGAGKTTISKLLARTLGYRYLDTGALYRGVAYAVQQAGIDPKDGEALRVLCRGLTLGLEDGGQGLRLILNGEDITARIRTPEISMLASAVSARPLIREFLLEIQRAIGREKRVVCEGRDMGTVVFPGADVKFFLDAAPGIRARRRFEELKAMSESAPSLEAVEADMIRRDHNDRTRAAAPLIPAADAIRVDSSALSVEQVVEAMLDEIRQRFH